MQRDYRRQWKWLQRREAAVGFVLAIVGIPLLWVVLAILAEEDGIGSLGRGAFFLVCMPLLLVGFGVQWVIGRFHKKPPPPPSEPPSNSPTD